VLCHFCCFRLLLIWVCHLGSVPPYIEKRSSLPSHTLTRTHTSFLFHALASRRENLYRIPHFFLTFVLSAFLSRVGFSTFSLSLTLTLTHFYTCEHTHTFSRAKPSLTHLNKKRGQRSRREEVVPTFSWTL